MRLFLNTNVSTLDKLGHNSHGDSEPNIAAIKSLQYEAFSLPIGDRILLEQGLESLSELQQKVVYLFFYKDLSQTEIGRRLGLPQRKVSRIISSATRTLKKRMSERYR
jgi:RNA polymerase sigma-B factor